MFLSQTCTDLAAQILIVAITWAALHQFGGSRLGLVLAAWAIPRGILLLFGGVLVDRADRRALGIAVGAVLCPLTLATAIVVGHGNILPWIAAAVVLGVLDAIRLPVGVALLPLLVARDQLIRANRWVSLREWLTMTAGPAVGGVLVAGLGAPGAVLTASALYAISSLVLFALPKLERAAPDQQPSLLRDLADGLRFVTGDPRLRVVLPCFAAANLFVLGLIGVAIPVLAKTVLAAGPQGLGLLSAGWGGGLVVGTLLCRRLPSTWAESQVAIFAMFIGSDLFLAAVGLAPNLPVALLAYLSSGLLAGPASVYFRTMLQTLPPEQYLGRVSGIARAMSFGLEPVSTAGVGLLSSKVSASTLLLVGGCAAAVADLTGLGLSRRVDAASGRAHEEPSHSVTTTG